MRLICLLRDGIRWRSAPLAIAALVLGACAPDAEAPPDISEVPDDLALDRYERALAGVAGDSTRDGAAVLRERYPTLFDSVWLAMMAPGGTGRDLDSTLVVLWGADPAYRRLLDTVTQVFPEGAAFEAQLREGFRYAKHYLPRRPTPRVATYVTGLNYKGFVYPGNLVGVGLDFYLGRDYPGYRTDVFPRYIQRSMNADHVAADVMDTWLGDVLGPEPSEKMVDRMLHNGKRLYLKTKLLPHVADTAVLGFSEAQLAWLTANEDQMWEHYLDEELLYETKASRIGKHVGLSPNAPGMPPEAPGGGANWVGMNVVRQYMERHPEASFEDLIALRDGQRLLSESRYRPMR